MSAAITILQGRLVAALAGDTELSAMIGAVVDAPPKGGTAPYVAILSHDVLARDGDLAPGWEHRLVLHAWHPDPSRKAVAGIAARVVAVALEAGLSGGGLAVTLARHVRTETRIDPRTGQARAGIHLRFHSEPAE